MIVWTDALFNFVLLEGDVDWLDQGTWSKRGNQSK